ncbi:hypothetical protein F2P81_008983 [Scophthalmus maximus]|uniref:Uncharacterized protein n=1 Tax=Scophthalmus maximus TaxID=52904 RepID=A0A6A4T0G1_SCOMX|nr:hypothetical protein F2P81_008983 [Scophthalmus maximus]
MDYLFRGNSINHVKPDQHATTAEINMNMWDKFAPICNTAAPVSLATAMSSHLPPEYYLKWGKRIDSAPYRRLTNERG